MPNDQTASSIVATTAGRVRGTSVDGMPVWFSIPYGASTGGANRFRPPQPVEPWAGVRDATAVTSQAPQMRGAYPNRLEVADFLGARDPAPQSEDCLTATIWSKSTATKLPVMVWLHGGAYSTGSGNADYVRGSRLARRDVVVVTINHRLNIFGFLDVSAIGGPEFKESGNAGLLDIVAGLRWVRDNIARFGGDPSCVTIFGESGGGAKVSALLAMPMAQGLFHRAIIQSGCAVRHRTAERAAAVTSGVLKALGSTSIATLQALPVAELLAAIAPAEAAAGPSPHPFFDRYPFGPMIDGDAVPDHPFDPAASTLSAGIPVMLGDTKDEAAGFTVHDDKIWNRTLTLDELRGRVRRLAGDRTDDVLATYAQVMPGLSPAEWLIAITTDALYRNRTVVAAYRMMQRAGAPIYMYSFAWNSPRAGGKLASPHAADVPFVFDTVDLCKTGAPADQTLSATMADVWAAFAITGQPQHAKIPHWPNYERGSRAMMIFEETPRITHDPGYSRRRIWTQITTATEG